MKQAPADSIHGHRAWKPGKETNEHWARFDCVFRARRGREHLTASHNPLSRVRSMALSSRLDIPSLDPDSALEKQCAMGGGRDRRCSVQVLEDRLTTGVCSQESAGGWKHEKKRAPGGGGGGGGGGSFPLQPLNFCFFHSCPLKSFRVRLRVQQLKHSPSKEAGARNGALHCVSIIVVNTETELKVSKYMYLCMCMCVRSVQQPQCACPCRWPGYIVVGGWPRQHVSRQQS